MSTKLEKIRVILGLTSLKFEDAKLLDGTLVTAEAMQAGYPMFTLNADGTKTPVGKGVYETDALLIETDELGIILTVTDKATVPPAVDPNAPVAPVAEAPVEGAVIDPNAPVEPVASAFTPEQITELTALITKILTELMGGGEDMKTKMTSVEKTVKELAEKYEKFAHTPAGMKIPTITTEAASIDPLDARVQAIMNLRKNK